MGELFDPISPRIQALLDKRDYESNHGPLQFNFDRTRIYTDYYRSHMNEYPPLRRAGALLEWCRTTEISLADEDIFAGNLGPTFRSINFYVEWGVKTIRGCVNDTDENFRAAWQVPGAVQITDAEREWLRDVADFWEDKTISAHVAGILPEEVWQLSGNGVNFAADRASKTVGTRCQGHYIGNFRKLIHTGFGAVRRVCQEKIDAMQGRVFGQSARPFSFYRAVIMICDAASTLAKRYGALCREKAELTADETRKAELLRMADSLDWIMENPCRNYWEALEATLLYEIMLCTDAQQHGQSIGRIDTPAGELLERELAAGTITREQAQEYTDAFILRLNDFLCADFPRSNNNVIQLNREGKNFYHSIGQYMTATSGINLTLGGVDQDGKDSTNTATILFLQTFGRLKLADPTVAVRIHDDTPDEVWQLAVESSRRSGGMPQFQNDKIIIPALVKRGLSLADARDYSIVGCVEPAGTGNSWPACGNNGAESTWSLLGCVVFAMHGGVNPFSGAIGLPCKKLYEYESFTEFQEAFVQHARYFLDWHISICSLYEQVYAEQFPCICASALIDGCVEQGMDATWGGAKYNSTGITCVGIANVADSLCAIKRLCFEKDSPYTARELYDALCADWEGYEQMRQHVINRLPHYGNDDPEVDALARWAMSVFADHLMSREGPRGRYCGGTFTMASHLFYGAKLPATPDGRKTGDPLADAISPRQGFDKNGPTAYMNSASKLPHVNLSNGDQLNIRFSPAVLNGKDGPLKVRNLIQTYFNNTGMQVQFNVVSTQQLHEAQEKPDEYRNLVVRIAGYSTYFVELPRVLQDDFITRTDQSF